MKSSLAKVCCLVLAAAFLASPALAACPTSYLATGCIGFDLNGEATDLPAAQFGDTGIEPWTSGDPCPYGCYDLRTGTSVATGFGGFQGCFYYPLTVDEFHVGGLPTGTPPLSFAAELWVDGTIEGDGAIRAGFGGNLTTWKSSVVKEKIVLPLVHAPGETFTLMIDLEALGAALPNVGSARASSTLYFSGLPAGAYVTSCQNYGLPVAVRASTWGAMKARYR